MKKLIFGLVLSLTLPLFASNDSLTDAGRRAILIAARQFLSSPEDIQISVPDLPGKGNRMVLLSLSREKATAFVSRGEGPTLLAALKSSAMSLRKMATDTEQK